MPTDSLRTMALYADGRQIAAGARFHLEGRSTMSCTADKFVLTLTGYEDSDLNALQRAKTLTVTGENDSLLAEAPAAEIRTSVENGVETCTVVLLDGGDFCCGCVSVAIRRDTTLEEALSTLLAHCDSPLPLVTRVNAPIRFSRGQVFFGRTVQAVKELAKSAGYRAYVTRGGLYLTKASDADAVMDLTETQLMETPAVLDGVTIVQTAVMGFQAGQCLRLPAGDAKVYRILAQAIEADSYTGAWSSQLVLLDEAAMEADASNDAEGLT